jgi:hypothetical protein
MKRIMKAARQRGTEAADRMRTASQPLLDIMMATVQHAQQVGAVLKVRPKPGAKSATRMAHEQQRWFRRGRHWRAGLEGRISGLKRRHKLDRCRCRGTAGMERWVGWGVIAQATAHHRVMRLPIRAMVPDVGRHCECILLPEGFRTVN